MVKKYLALFWSLSLMVSISAWAAPAQSVTCEGAGLTGDELKECKQKFDNAKAGFSNACTDLSFALRSSCMGVLDKALRAQRTGEGNDQHKVVRAAGLTGQSRPKCLGEADTRRKSLPEEGGAGEKAVVPRANGAH